MSSSNGTLSIIPHHQCVNTDLLYKYSLFTVAWGKKEKNGKMQRTQMSLMGLSDHVREWDL